VLLVACALDILAGMPDGRTPISAALERDLKLEVGYRCPMPQCRVSELDRAHLIDYSKTRDDSFGNQIMLCPTCHRKHTNGVIKTQDLRVLKARLAWDNDRYTGTEYKVLSLFAQHGGTYFGHPKKWAQCLRFLLADGYMVRVKDDVLSGVPIDVYHFTRNGQFFVRAWLESGAPQFRFNVPDAKPLRAS
jgi:hypothetical protein